MCRSIRTLRPPHVEQVTTGDVEAAARQYVRKLTGFREPAPHNAAAFAAAVEQVAAATRAVLTSLEVRGAGPVEIVDGPASKPPRRDRVA